LVATCHAKSLRLGENWNPAAGGLSRFASKSRETAIGCDPLAITVSEDFRKP
jgi:hypothetical protein